MTDPAHHDGLVAEIRARHIHVIVLAPSGICSRCFDPYPCDAIRLADALELAHTGLLDMASKIVRLAARVEVLTAQRSEACEAIQSAFVIVEREPGSSQQQSVLSDLLLALDTLADPPPVRVGSRIDG